jgi:hypothetical protein
MNPSSRILTFALILAIPLFANAADKVYRWVDEDGNVHYSESLPPDFQDKSHDQLDRSGLVREEGMSLKPPPPKPKPKEPEELKELPRDASGMQRPRALYSEDEMQERMDRFLLLRYESEDEITDAMNVEIKQLEYDAANTQRAGLDVSPEIKVEIEELKERLASNQQTMDKLQEREDKIRADFGVQLDRYRHLLETWSEES